MQAPAWRSPFDDDSTSAQYGDTSSHHSPIDDSYEPTDTAASEQTNFRRGFSAAARHPNDPRAHHHTLPHQQVVEREEPPTSQGSTLEVYELDDGGYEGDVEVRYPDGYEEVDSGAEESSVSQLTLEESNDDHEALTEKLRKLKVKEGKHKNVQESSQRHDGGSQHLHKRTRSGSFDSLSEENGLGDDERAMSSPAQKRARHQTGSTYLRIDAHDNAEAMDMS